MQQNSRFKFYDKYILSLIILTVFSASCNEISPAGFWNQYQTDCIVFKESDQGPWGGYRKIIWKSNQINRFNKQNIIDFATNNGWELTDSLIFSNDSIIHRKKYKENDYSLDILKDIEPLNSTLNYVFIFKTGWIAVEPGNARDTDKNGFVLINSDGTEFSIYHLWGE